jgi:hypothetical protein
VRRRRWWHRHRPQAARARPLGTLYGCGCGWLAMRAGDLAAAGTRGLAGADPGALVWFSPQEYQRTFGELW